MVQETAIGDMSNIYFVDERVPQRIYESLGPNIKLLFMLRHPVKRLYSRYRMNKALFLDTRPLEEILRQTDEERAELSLKLFGHPYDLNYLAESRYAENIRRYLEVFPMENMLFIIFEEFVAEPGPGLEKIFRFLDVDPAFKPDLSDGMNGAGVYTRHTGLARIYHSTLKYRRIKRFVQQIVGEENCSKMGASFRKGFFRPEPAPNEAIKPETYRYLLDLLQPDVLELEKILSRDLSIWKE